ncbi:carbamoyltransferase HypF [Mesobacillus zeae]|uniref:Carbamoyltransferase n=1 Tax=Mesobacillus zeae TaxID=1917180 RepID=A0A398B2Q3_9BACI|nr:carbamoyltransferase HypF [Mesobacillus zeae]RID84135.1 carbamoyltransferase HypF [Mesobacillus zeae]
MQTAVNIKVRGRVQGVGFRPFIFQIAECFGIKGTVQNNMDGVNICAEGSKAKIESFIESIRSNAPRLSKIQQIVVETATPAGASEFKIIPSLRQGSSMLVIPIDSAVCDDCLEEMRNPNDFRYHYPFINCTQCGPRYTIISELPYDRPFTSMEVFPMCSDCQSEYDNPRNRRHHAQPIACPTCGPKVSLFGSDGSAVPGKNAIKRAAEMLKTGLIVAVKGLGGYHLCCDARNDAAVAMLRKRKNRLIKPLAVMAGSIETIKGFAEMDERGESLLRSPEAPIVILRKGKSFNLAEQVAPGMKSVGVMLPYTPLHHLLFDEMDSGCLVMTSANPSSLPILYKDEEAFQYLGGIADYILVHNRTILHPVDDSVLQLTESGPEFIRRSRGYVPDPLVAPFDVSGIIAFGGQQKATFTIGRNEQIFVGPHIGDLENIETIEHYQTELDHLRKWVDTPLLTAVIDAHPGYNSRRIAGDYSFGEVIEVQHHHAHMAACMADNQLTGDSYGIILDGTGMGTDGKIWGFEILYGNERDFIRRGHLKYTPLPGGDKAIKEPWRNAAAMLISLLGCDGEQVAGELFPEKRKEISILKMMIEKKFNTVEAGTCGRLFDAVSAMCGIGTVSTYDGEAAIRLGELADEDIWTDAGYPFYLGNSDGRLIFDFTRMLEEIARDVLNGSEKSIISRKFHETIVNSIVEAMHILTLEHRDSSRRVVLSGGSFHNRYLSVRLQQELTKQGFSVYVHQNIPCNDGGLSYGQLIVAAAKRRK